MKVPKEPTWERLISRFLTAHGIPGFRFLPVDKRFTGVRGFAFVRCTPKIEVGGWKNMPYYFKRFESERQNGNPHPVVMFITSKHNGPNVDDTFVMMRLETYAPMLKALVESDPSRYLGEN